MRTNTVQGQTSLSVILDEIETTLGVSLCLDPKCDYCPRIRMTNALVKALRKALMVAKIMPSAAYERITDNFKVDMLPNDLQADYDTLEQEVTAILNGENQ